MFGVAPGTGPDTNANAIAALDAQHRVHQRRAHRRRRRVVGGAHRRASPRTSPTGRATTGRPASDAPAAHPNSRFTAPLSQVPCVAPEWEDPNGVPISAILFGGRRRTHGAARHRGVQLAPRRVPRFDHGIGDDRGRGRRGRQPAPRSVRDVAVLRLPHGRLLRALAAHRRGGRRRRSCPKLFYVNWFRKDADGKFLWPGYGENSRVLAWIFDRCGGDAAAIDTAIGRLPTADALPTDGLDARARRARRAALGRRERVARRAAADRGALRGVRRPPADDAARRARRARQAALRALA